MAERQRVDEFLLCRGETLWPQPKAERQRVDEFLLCRGETLWPQPKAERQKVDEFLLCRGETPKCILKNFLKFFKMVTEGVFKNSSPPPNLPPQGGGIKNLHITRSFPPSIEICAPVVFEKIGPAIAQTKSATLLEVISVFNKLFVLYSLTLIP